jgi:formylglycine-generating enzyme required for sulfatase activity
MPNRRMLALAPLVTIIACTPAQTLTAQTGQATQETQSSAQLEADSRVFRDCADCPEMVRIPAGSFMMGSPADEPERQADEGPLHRVEIAKPFAISAFEISTGEYRRFIESTGRKDVDWKMQYTWTTVDFPNQPANPDAYPAAAVSWQDARDYAAWLSQQTGKHYRLPTEAEWEYVARAGNPTARYEPDSLRKPLPGAVSASAGNYYPVTEFAANAFGVHGLTANMGEWLEDCYTESYEKAPMDGRAVEGECKRRAVRGSSNYFSSAYERIANRDWGFAVKRGDGVRLARDLP